MKQVFAMMVALCVVMSIPFGLAREVGENTPSESSSSREMRESAKEFRETQQEEVVILRQEKSLERARSDLTTARSSLREVKERFKQCKDKESAECAELKRETHEKTKNFLGNSADAILTALARARERVENSDLSEEEKTQALTQLDAKIQEIEGAKAVIVNLGGESTPEQIKEAAQLINAAWKKTEITLKKNVGKAVASRVESALKKLDKLGERLGTLLAKAQERGTDTTALASLIEKFKADVEAAQEAYNSANELYNAATTPEQLKEGKNALKLAHDQLKAARDTLKQIVVELKKVRA